jgi:hypothetical protein
VRYHGREPVSAPTRMMGEDMLVCMLGDVYTDVEKTMIELQRQALVHEIRSTFQQAMEHRFIAAVERLTGRRVARFISAHHVGPDLEARTLPARTLTRRGRRECAARTPRRLTRGVPLPLIHA